MSTDRAALAESLLSFMQLATQATSEAALLKALLKSVSPFGVTHVSAGVTTDANRVFKIGTGQKQFGRPNMAWSNAYFGQRLFRWDPVLAHSLKAQRSEYWDRAIDMKALARPGKRVLGMAADAGLRDGFLSPSPLFSGDVMIVSFQGEEIDRDPAVEAFLRGVAMYYGTEGYRLVTNAKARGGAFAGLTARQVQALHLAALGKRQDEIAFQMGVSINTIEYHLKTARRRLGARTTTEAVALLNSTPKNLFTSYGNP